jgi:transposase
MGRVYAGVDVGSKTFHLTAMDDGGAVVRDKKYDTSRQNLLRSVEGLEGEVWVHLEAASMARWVRSVLRERVARIVVSHPKTNAWIAKDPLKRDELDALKLAKLLRMGELHEVYYGEDELGAFKEVVQHYDDVTEQQADLKVKIKGRLKQQGIMDGGDALFTKSGRREVLGRVTTATARRAIEQLYELMDGSLQVQRKALGLVKTEAAKHPVVAKLDGVPGIALVSAARFVSYIQEPRRFATKQKLWRYCRLGITDRSSDGKPLGRKSLDWNGNGRLKQLSRTAFLGALKARADNRFKRAYEESLKRTHSSTHARLNVQRKILTTLWAMWKGGTDYQDEKG